MDMIDMKNKATSIIAGRFRGSYGAGDCADEILSLLAPVLEKAQKYDEAYSRWPSIVDHERWWKETKKILETREVKDGQ